MCRLSALLALLAIGVLVHLGRERGETSDVESRLPDVVVVVDDGTPSTSAESSSCGDDDDGLDSLLGATGRPGGGCAADVNSGGSAPGGGVTRCMLREGWLSKPAACLCPQRSSGSGRDSDPE